MKLVALFAAAALFVAADASAKDELGLNVHASTKVGQDVTRDSKLGWVRIDVNWFQIEPTQGQYDWSLMDQVVSAATSRGLKVLAVLAYGPAWASVGDTKSDGSSNDVPKPGTYATFVTAAVAHFGSNVIAYELWNEPNLGQFFEGTPQTYASNVLVPGADALHAACAKCLAVGPGLATVGGQYDVWMDASLTAAADKLDVISGHIYAGFPDPSNTIGKTSDSFLDKLESHRILKLGNVIVYEGPLSFKEVLDKHQVTKPFWITETGMEAPISDPVALAAQTVYVRHVLETMLARPWWSNTIFYEGFDEPNTGYTWGFALDDPTAKLGYQPKPVMGLTPKVVAHNALFGGDGADCADGLDNDGDGLVDYPDDPDCKSPLGKSEGLPPVDAGAPADSGDDATTAPATASGDAGCNASGRPSGAAWWIVALACLARRRRA